MRSLTGVALLVLCAELASTAQPLPAPSVAPPAAPPMTINLQTALERARNYALPLQSAIINAALAREDRIQAKAAMLPSLNHLNQYIYTEGNGTPSGVFVANDGVHVYNEQAVIHQELFSIVRRAEYRRAVAAEAVARARQDIAARGLVVTVVQSYYTLVAQQRRYANAERSLEEAQRFVDITGKQERGGEAAHSDVVKARLQLQQRQRDVLDAQLAVDKARINLAVLLFPDFNQEFTVVDDLESASALAPFSEIKALATERSPELRAAQAGLQEASWGVSIARNAYLPSLGFDFFYGINANTFSIYTGSRRNLGYSAQITLNIPVWNWGATQSKLRQARLRQNQAQLELRLTQRQLLANINSFYLEAQLARTQLESLRSSLDLASQSLRLTILRYQAGEATALEVVDAQTTLAQARNAYDDGLSRYRVSLANLQTLTGTL